MFGRYAAVTDGKQVITWSRPPEVSKPEVTFIGDVIDCGWECWEHGVVTCDDNSDTDDDDDDDDGVATDGRVVVDVVVTPGR